MKKETVTLEIKAIMCRYMSDVETPGQSLRTEVLWYLRGLRGVGTVEAYTVTIKADPQIEGGALIEERATNDDTKDNAHDPGH